MPNAVMIGKTTVDQAKAAEQAAIKARKAAEAKATADAAAAAKQRAEQAKAVEDAKKATQPTGAIPPTAPTAPVPPTAPGAAMADDKDSKADIKKVLEEVLEMLGDDMNSNDGSWDHDLKTLVGKIWDAITPDSQPDTKSVDNGVSGVRGSRQISMRVDAKEEKEPEDLIPGGEADNIPEEKLNKKQLDMGQKVEMEHTDDPKKSREIARDHLAEELKDGKEKGDQEYYTKLKKVHEDKCSDSIPEFWRKNLDYGDR